MWQPQDNIETSLMTGSWRGPEDVEGRECHGLTTS